MGIKGKLRNSALRLEESKRKKQPEDTRRGETGTHTSGSILRGAGACELLENEALRFIPTASEATGQRQGQARVRRARPGCRTIDARHTQDPSEQKSPRNRTLVT